MTNLFPVVVTVSILLLLLFMILLVIKTKSHAQVLDQQLKSLKAEQAATLKQALKRQQQNIKIVEQENVEQLRLIQHLDKTTLELRQGIAALDSKLEELQQHDPEIKLYQQAKQLIASGTSIDEVVESCGIPRAEVELLISLNT